MIELTWVSYISIIITGELIWMNPFDRSYSIEWDEMMCSENSVEVEVRQLMAKAFKGTPSTHVLLIFENGAKLHFEKSIVGFQPKSC